MDKPWLLDLFCGAGGAGEGYRRAGFHVVSCDLEPQPRNPHEFYQGDALTVLDALLAGEAWQGYTLHDFQAIHASPPCQDYSTGNTWLRSSRTRKAHARLLQPVRERLIRSGRMWVMENVRLALEEMVNPLLICGTSLGLRVQRHRLFDSNMLLFAAGPCQHRRGDLSVRTCRAEYLRTGIGPIRLNGRGEPFQRNEGAGVEVCRTAMGIDWMTMHELGEAIPPAYTEWIGAQLLRAVSWSAAA